MKTISTQVSSEFYDEFKRVCNELGYHSIYKCVKEAISFFLSNKSSVARSSLLPLDVRVYNLEKSLEKLTREINEIKKRLDRIEKSTLLGYRR